MIIYIFLGEITPSNHITFYYNCYTLKIFYTFYEWIRHLYLHLFQPQYFSQRSKLELLYIILWNKTIWYDKNERISHANTQKSVIRVEKYLTTRRRQKKVDIYVQTGKKILRNLTFISFQFCWACHHKPLLVLSLYVLNYLSEPKNNKKIFSIVIEWIKFFLLLSRYSCFVNICSILMLSSTYFWVLVSKKPKKI